MKNCRDVIYLIASDGLEYASWPTRLMTRLHLRSCGPCGQYVEELAMIGRIGREVLSPDSVSRETVQRLEGSIMDHVLRGHDEDHQATPGGEAN